MRIARSGASAQAAKASVNRTRPTRKGGGGTVGQQWVVDGYTLMFASLLLFDELEGFAPGGR